MTDFNSYMGNIDTDFFRELCLRNGELRYYKRNEFILREGEVGSFFGFIVSGVIKYTCINQTENKTYNVGFSFANEFISDYPNCLYNIKSELNIQAITPCRIYICSSELLLQEFEENKENQRIARIAAEQLFFQSYSRYLDLFRFTSEERYLQLLKKCPVSLIRNANGSKSLSRICIALTSLISTSCVLLVICKTVSALLLSSVPICPRVLSSPFIQMQYCVDMQIIFTRPSH